MKDLYWFEDVDGIPVNVEDDFNTMCYSLQLLHLLYDKGLQSNFPNFVRFHMDSVINDLSNCLDGLVRGFHSQSVSVEDFRAFLSQYPTRANVTYLESCDSDKDVG